MKKKKNIDLFIVIALLFSGAIIWILFLSKPITELPPEPAPKLPAEEAEKEIFGLTGWVLETDTGNNFLIVKAEKDKKELKAFVGEDTNLLKLEVLEEYPGNGYVVTIKTPMDLADFQRGDYISLRTRKNIADKAEFGEVIQISFYPSIARLKE